MRIVGGHFENDGADVNVPLGFVPDYVRVYFQSAATGEVAVIDSFLTEMGDDKGFWFTKLADNGATTLTTIIYKTGGGGETCGISAYNSGTSYDTGTENDDDDPVRATGGKGFTLDVSDITGGTGIANGTEVWYMAILFDKDTDHGDINA
ncbi:MAG: hypothetical protein ABIJ57_02695 [Pseudomonadota bacterium]